MTLVECLPYLIICFIAVCVVSFAIGLNVGKGGKNSEAAIAPVPVAKVADNAEMSCGQLKLINIDERTAAMAMAIVSDKSGIPLNELCFKSIKLKY